MKPKDAEWCWEQQKQIRELSVSYFGVPLKKCPLDLWIYQEIIWGRKPEVIVEVGNLYGGSTLFLAHLLDQIGGEVIAVDWKRDLFQVEHQRITPITGDMADPAIIERIRRHVDGRTCMVIHDADHQSAAVYRDLESLHGLVTPGQYFVVEDGIIDEWWRHGQKPARKLGPLDAINRWLPDHPEFRQDASRERYGVTWNPGGYLERIK